MSSWGLANLEDARKEEWIRFYLGYGVSMEQAKEMASFAMGEPASRVGTHKVFRAIFAIIGVFLAMLVPGMMQEVDHGISWLVGASLFFLWLSYRQHQAVHEVLRYIQDARERGICS